MESIRAENLGIAYEKTTIIEALHMQIPQGKITALIGPNGSGKSTVLKALGRILRPQNGSVYLNGKDIRSLSTQAVARKMAILPQCPLAPSGLTVSELVAYGRFPHQQGFGSHSPEDRRIIAWSLAVTGLAAFAGRFVDTLSGGQRQRVWIAMALAQQTELILLDEPTTYLDLSHQLEILELLGDLNKSQGCTIVMVLHDLNLAARFADYMIAIRSGAVICHGVPAAVMVPAMLRDVFQIDAQVINEARTGRPVCITYDLVKSL
ncbi:ABC transporter ATP-binding protein [Sporomusa termitida]|uniref:Putative siderophore transport system ATP-binding protein YusV n=1 Tax=Sporomusa termitida TaxID=2377 RepID=A0A517E047_9FIRM|nr:ABC transporter ATP-binding protein [Sporomusa termitida]QDR82977.1 putative siderophore transport system ATP-binding protein YusV [Sporomusa termitida]